MSEKKYLDSDTAYDAGTLSDWYISSVDDSDPIWTDAHIDELVNDFYVIPKDTPAANVAPVVHAYWKRVQANHNTFRCSRCHHIRELNHMGERIATPKLCEMCGAHMNGKPPESEDFYNATN